MRRRIYVTYQHLSNPLGVSIRLCGIQDLPYLKVGISKKYGGEIRDWKYAWENLIEREACECFEANFHVVVLIESGILILR